MPWMLTQLWLITMLPSLIARFWVGPQTKGWFPPSSVSDGWRQTINVLGRAHRSPACDFLVSWLQVAVEPFAFSFDYMFYHSV